MEKQNQKQLKRLLSGVQLLNLALAILASVLLYWVRSDHATLPFILCVFLNGFIVLWSMADLGKMRKILRRHLFAFGPQLVLIVYPGITVVNLYLLSEELLLNELTMTMTMPLRYQSVRQYRWDQIIGGAILILEGIYFLLFYCLLNVYKVQGNEMAFRNRIRSCGGIFTVLFTILCTFGIPFTLWWFLSDVGWASTSSANFVTIFLAGFKLRDLVYLMEYCFFGRAEINGRSRPTHIVVAMLMLLSVFYFIWVQWSISLFACYCGQWLLVAMVVCIKWRM